VGCACELVTVALEPCVPEDGVPEDGVPEDGVPDAGALDDAGLEAAGLSLCARAGTAKPEATANIQREER